MNDITLTLLNLFERPKTKDEVVNCLLELDMNDVVYDYFVKKLDHANLNPDNFAIHPLFDDLVDDVCADLDILE